jgi:hypothetical protein
MSVRLRPSFVRCAAWVTFVLALLAVATYFWPGEHENHWWTRDYMLSLLIPFAIAPLIVWLMFVPSRLELAIASSPFSFRSGHSTGLTGRT